MPRVTVKWPNDVLLHSYNADSQSTKVSHEKVAGILIESSQDWFLIGIGINVGYAPEIPPQGIDFGRKATSLSRYCGSLLSESGVSHEQVWIEASKKLAKEIAFDIHSWLHPSSPSSSQMGDSILREWKSYVDWNMELVLRDTANKEKVVLKQVLEDGRVVVEEVETGLTRTLVSDYFL
jgi:biotin-(acetyl-CoA carboxylase) ligase